MCVCGCVGTSSLTATSQPPHHRLSIIPIHDFIETDLRKTLANGTHTQREEKRRREKETQTDKRDEII